MKSRNKYPKHWAFAGTLLMLVSCSAPVAEKKSPDADTAILALLAQPTGHTVFSSQQTVRFGDVQEENTVSANGIIIPDERRTNKIAARVSGRIEKLYVRFPYQYVKKGEKLLDLYSPDLNTAISEYLFLWKKDKTSSLTAQSKQKLLLLGLTAAQIGSFENSGEVPAVISLYSAYEGYVVPSAATGQSGNMIETSSGNTMSNMNSLNGKADADLSSASPLFREGAYIAAGQTLFSVNDAEEVIALLSVEQNLQSSIKTGAGASIVSELLPGQSISGTISLVEPALESGQKFLSVRVVLSNPGGELKYNSLVKAELKTTTGKVNMLPSSCVFDLGKRKIVWLKSADINLVHVFTPIIVITGNETDGYTEILSGLTPGEEVARDAGLLVDREGIINTELK